MVAVDVSNLIFQLAAILLSCVSVSEAYEYCPAYTDFYGRYQHGFYCYGNNYCCGRGTSRYCCHHGLAGSAIGGIVFTLFVIVVVISIIVCCCNSSCPLYRSRYRGRVVTWWGNRGVVGTTTVTTTTVNPHPRPVVVHQGAAAPMAPQYGHSAPYGTYMAPQPQNPHLQPYYGPAGYPPPPSYAQATATTTTTTVHPAY